MRGGGGVLQGRVEEPEAKKKGPAKRYAMDPPAREPFSRSLLTACTLLQLGSMFIK